MKNTIDPTTEGRDALEEVRSQGKLNHLAGLIQDHAEKLALYAHYNHAVEARDEAYALQLVTREFLDLLAFDRDEKNTPDLAAEAHSLAQRLHGAFTGAAKHTPLFLDLKRFLHAVEKGGES